MKKAFEEYDNSFNSKNNQGYQRALTDAIEFLERMKKLMDNNENEYIRGTYSGLDMAISYLLDMKGLGEEDD